MVVRGEVVLSSRQGTVSIDRTRETKGESEPERSWGLLISDRGDPVLEMQSPSPPADVVKVNKSLRQPNSAVTGVGAASSVG